MIVKHVWSPQQPPRKNPIADRIAAKVEDSGSQHHVERRHTAYKTSVEQNGQRDRNVVRCQ